MYSHGVGQGFTLTAPWVTAALSLGTSYGLILSVVIDWVPENFWASVVTVVMVVAPWFMANRYQPRLLARLITRGM